MQSLSRMERFNAFWRPFRAVFIITSTERQWLCFHLCLFVCIFCLCVRACVRARVCLGICLSVPVLVHVPVPVYVCLCVYLSVCISVCPHWHFVVGCATCRKSHPGCAPACGVHPTSTPSHMKGNCSGGRHLSKFNRSAHLWWADTYDTYGLCLSISLGWHGQVHTCAAICGARCASNAIFNILNCNHLLAHPRWVGCNRNKYDLNINTWDAARITLEIHYSHVNFLWVVITTYLPIFVTYVCRNYNFCMP